MRIHWPEGCVYSLAGEVDKAGHPLVRGNGLYRVKPDFLVHVPGDMKRNYAVVEVKPANASPNGVDKDIEKLKNFIGYAEYERGILLVYGKKFDALQKQLRKVLLQGSKEIDIWIHSQPSTRPERVSEEKLNA